MKRYRTLAVILVVMGAGLLFAQRDSLCMRVVDEWDVPDSLDFNAKDIEVVGDYIYVAAYYGLWVFSLSDSGILSVDTLLLVPPHHVTQIAVQDTIAYIGTDTNLVVLNISNPARPESLITYTGLIGTGGGHHLYTNDTILYCTNMEWTPDFTGDIGRFNISDPFDVHEIYTFSTETYNGWAFNFPYFMAVGGDEYNRTSMILADVSLGDTILSDTVMCDCSLIWTDRYPKDYAVRDTFIFTPCMLSYVRSFMTNLDFDTLIFLDEYSEPWYEGDGGGFLLSDSLLFVSWDNLIRVFNTVNPKDIRKIGEYRFDRPLYYGYYDFVYIDSFLVATFYNGVVIFKFPCKGCDITEATPHPIPAAIPIERGTGFIHSELEIRLYDIRGRELARGRTIDTTRLHNGLYIANNGTGSIKVSVVR